MARLDADFGGKLPDDFDTLVSLPGIGRKTANLLVATVYGQPGFMPMVYYCQIGQFLLLALCAAGSVLAAVRRGGGLYGAAGFYPRLSLFGVMLFLSFWETKPRYALHFAPVLLFCAALAVAELAALRPRAARPAPETPEKTLLPLA